MGTMTVSLRSQRDRGEGPLDGYIAASGSGYRAGGGHLVTGEGAVDHLAVRLYPAYDAAHGIGIHVSLSVLVALTLSTLLKSSKKSIGYGR